LGCYGFNWSRVSNFEVGYVAGVLTTREVLDREARAEHELVGEARDGGSPARAARVRVRVRVLDVNDNEPVLVDPPGDVMSVREELPPGTVVGRARGVDADLGENATITYAIEPGNGKWPGISQKEGKSGKFHLIIF